MQLLDVNLNEIEETIVPSSAPRQKSLAAIGQRRSVVLRPNGNGGYRIVEGHRRVADARGLGWSSIKAMVGEMDDIEAAIDSLASNVSRSPNPMHEAYDIGFLVAEGWTEEKIAEHVGRTQGFISQRKGLLNLVPELQRMTESGKLSISAARKVCRLSPADQQAFLEAGDYTIDDAAEALAAGKSQKSNLADIDMPDTSDTIPLPGQFISGFDMARAAADGEIEVEWQGQRFRIVRV